MKCNDCVFRGIFQDMGASCDACNLHSDLVDAIKACDNSESCRHRFTIQEAKKIVIEREGEPKVEKKRSEEQTAPQTLDDAFGEIAKAIQSVMIPLVETLFELKDTVEGLTK